MDTFFKTCLSSASYLLSGTPLDAPPSGVVVDAGGQLRTGSGKTTGAPTITSPLAYISTAKHKIHAYTNSTGLIFDDTPVPPTTKTSSSSPTTHITKTSCSCSSAPTAKTLSSSPTTKAQNSSPSTPTNTLNSNSITFSKTPIPCPITPTTKPLTLSPTTKTPTPIPTTSTKPPIFSPINPELNNSKHAGQWVRPLGYAERFMTLSHDYGCMTTVYALWLESRSPIQFSLIKQATVLMFRKMPNLRMHLGYHRGDVWWREMTREVVDVEEMTSDNVEETVQELLQCRYNMLEGPLWFARFVTLGEHDQYVTDTNHNVKYKYVCIFGFHHNVSDGSTNMKFCQVFLKVLNDLCQGNTVDLCQEGTFAMPLQDRLGEQAASIWFYMGVFLRRAYTILLTFSYPVWNFTSYYRMPRERHAGTHLLQHELNEITTSNLLKRCKMEGVTLNSAFTAAANLALYTMMLEKNKNVGLTYLCSQQAINMRRYWPKEQRNNAFGCHISLLDLSFPTEEEDLDAFWEYTRLVHSLLNYHLTQTKMALKLQPMSVRLGILIRHNAILAKLGLPSGNDNHYTVTNMGNLSTTFPGTGPEVEVSRVLRTVSCHFMPTLCQHTLQTFRGRLSYSLDFYTQKLTRETASEYALTILNILTSSIHKPN